MAGRGTDIKLGGLEQDSSYEKNKQIALDGGGLFIIGTERHESRRIDNQLRGRSGRQGDPGSSKFFLSLEDDLMRIFGSEKLDSVLQTLGLEENNHCNVLSNEYIQKKTIFTLLSGETE